MNTRLLATGCLSLATLITGQLSAQDVPPPSGLQAPQPKSPDRYGLSFRMGFNIKADFKTAFGSSNPGSDSTTHGVDRTYDDGYNKVDSSGNQLGYTRYWGYDNNSQYDPNDGGALTLHSAAGSALSKDRNGDPQLGLEVTYHREVDQKKHWCWGFEAAFNYMNLTIHDNRPLTASGTLISDTYPLNGVVPPPAPYAHGADLSPNGNPVISDTASRATSALTAGVAGFRRLDADVFLWRLGPYAEVPLGPRALLAFSGGLSLGGIASDFSFNQTIHTTTGDVPARGSSSNADFLVGGFVGGTLNVALAKGWSAFAGAQFQNVGHYDHSAGNSRARLDLSESVFVTLGASYSF